MPVGKFSPRGGAKWKTVLAAELAKPDINSAIRAWKTDAGDAMPLGTTAGTLPSTVHGVGNASEIQLLLVAQYYNTPIYQACTSIAECRQALFAFLNGDEGCQQWAPKQIPQPAVRTGARAAQ